MKTQGLFAAILLAVFAFAISFGQDPEAIVRVQAGNSLGSGTVFYRSAAGDAFVLTNHHVAGRKGSRVSIEFWNDGRLQNKVPGIVVEAQINDGYTDVAIVRVAKADLGALDPPFIPLAQPGTRVANETLISSRGCPGGVWQCQFVGRTKEADDKRMEFYPRPGGGRSGSSVLVLGKNEIAGLLTWSSGKPNYEDHGNDGSGYSSGFGIAQQIDSVWAVVRGQATLPADARPEHYEPLVYHPIDAVNETVNQDDVGRIHRRFRFGGRRDSEPSPPSAPAPAPRDLPSPQDGEPPPLFDLPSEGPQAQPEKQLPPATPGDEDGLLSRRFGPPQQPNVNPPSDDGLLFRREGERTGPIRRMIGSVVGFFRVVLWLFAAYGAWCALSKLRGLSKAVVPLILFFTLVPCGFAQEPPSAYVQELENRSSQWQTEPVASTERWGSYGAALAAAKKDKSPLLVLVTMPGCPGCDQLKSRLKLADRGGWLNETQTCIVDSQREPQLAEKMKPEAYPTLIVYQWDDQGQQYKQAAKHTGAFGLTSGRAVPEADGSIRIEVAYESLEDWLVEAGVK